MSRPSSAMSAGSTVNPPRQRARNARPRLMVRTTSKRWWLNQRDRRRFCVGSTFEHVTLSAALAPWYFDGSLNTVKRRCTASSLSESDDDKRRGLRTCQRVGHVLRDPRHRGTADRGAWRLHDRRADG